MATRIFPIALGFDQCYVLKADGVIAVDAGAPNRGGQFARGLRRASIDSREVQLVVLTHGHWDHIGSAKEIRDLTGAKLAMHCRETRWLEGSRMPLSPGVTSWGADAPAAVSASWRRLLEHGATTVYPAHGKPFPADVIRRSLS